MKKNKYIFLLCVIFLCSLFAGCGKEQVGTSEDNAIVEEKVEQKVFRFGFSGINMANPYFVTLEEAVRESVEEDGHTMITKDPGEDCELQIQQIDEMIEEGIDAIFLCPVSWDKITPALEHLKEAKVKIINIDTQVREMDYVDAYIGSDNKEAGSVCGRDLIEQFPDGGKVVIIESTTQNSIKDRIAGFEATIAEKGFEIVERADIMSDRVSAEECCESIFANNTDITAVMCGNDQIALGVQDAAKKAGITDTYIYGVDGSPELKQELYEEDTLIRGTVSQTPINIGKKAVKVAYQILNKEKFDKITYEDVFFINAENVDMYGIDGWQ